MKKEQIQVDKLEQLLYRETSVIATKDVPLLMDVIHKEAIQKSKKRNKKRKSTRMKITLCLWYAASNKYYGDYADNPLEMAAIDRSNFSSNPSSLIEMICWAANGDNLTIRVEPVQGD